MIKGGGIVNPDPAGIPGSSNNNNKEYDATLKGVLVP